MIKYLRGATGIGLGITIKYLRRTTRQQPGHHGQVPATHNERRRGKRSWHHGKYLRRTTSGTAGNCPGTTIKYLRYTTSGSVGATA
jgi:hypothetical protein